MQRFIIAGFALALAACGPAAENTGGEAQTAQSQTGDVACDPQANALTLGATASGEITATTQPYPANARYYCVNVPAGTGSVAIELSGLSADLDLYVGYGDIASVQGVDLTQGETYDWQSNDFGTVDERVTINNPQPGVYYIEVVSYEGQPSAFQIAAR
mgnify:CR=1 FL=1